MPAQFQSASGGDDPQDDLLKRQAQIAAQAAKANNIPPVGTTAATIPPTSASTVNPTVNPTINPTAGPEPKVKTLDELPSDAKQIQEVINQEVKEAVVKPSEPPKPAEHVAPATQNSNSILELTKADIFKLLGMSQIPEAEKKKNLDEMEETIWADFVAEDLPKMLKPEDQARFEDLLKTTPSAEKVINFFGTPPSGGLPSNFEEKYLAKTLEFKAEIAKEQIATLLETVDDPQKKATLQKAKASADQGFWKQVEDLMVTLG